LEEGHALVNMKVCNRNRWRSVASGITVQKDRVAIAFQGMEDSQGCRKHSIKTIAVKVRNRGAMKFDVVSPTLGNQRWKTEPFDRQIFSVLETEDGGDAKFPPEPGNIFQARIFADEKGGHDFTDLGPPRAAVMRKT
jgi:hypothetical protein